MLKLTLWTLQFLLAAAFVAHGWMFLFPPANLVAQMNASIPPALRIFIGAAELAAAMGLTLPTITRVRPALVPGAAVGLMVVMVCATVFHIVRGEFSSALVTSVLLALLSFLAYARWRLLPIRPRRVA